MSKRIWFDNVLYVYVFECFLLAELSKLVVKSVCKLAYKQFLVTICVGSIASKALKGFCRFLFIFYGTLVKYIIKYTTN